MKRLLTVAVIVLFSCAGNKNKVDEAVESYVKKHTNDPSAYQPIESKVDSLFIQSYEETKEGMYLADSVKRLNGSLLDNMNLFDEKYKEAIGRIKDTLDARNRRFTPVWYGWKVIHNYRAKNALGALISTVDTFYVNKDNKVVKVGDQYVN
jgi:hypothetical protein